ncbi:MAG: HNH endonuclease [Selenomonadaceae bacterium]|nr:HNH endonuclease [Selenomonadaceae bacterium]
MPYENIYNNLYERAKNGEHFTNLMPLVLSRENILLAYRNIKNNTGSKTAGTDKLTIADQPLYDKSIEYADNRISLYLAQKGKCAVTGESFTSTEEFHCHHKIPKSKSGTDDYKNLILITATVHKLIRTTNTETIKKIERCVR